ncbi:uncharacterized protein [Choristoneura fumiferana]|uniref:uncharacterized protein n=1 Tax=Choristoneura fumiferana TaxID=7141 RepID=UPI003D15ECCD
MPNAARVIRTSMYVDDSLFGANTIEDALQVRDEFISLLNIASFQLHKWAANHPALLADIPADKQHFNERELAQQNLSMKALGVSYDISNDQFKITRPTSEPTKWNKRSVLSFISSFFDPLGLAAPVILKAKQFMQRLWLDNLEWDSPLPQEFLKDWLKFYQCLNSMPVICVNRDLDIHNANNVEIFGFCDASAGAIGAVIYVKVIKSGTAKFTLLCAKSRVAPIKTRLTIPKLELNAAVLLAQLYSKVASIFGAIKVDKNYLFSDSQVTLCWLTSARTNLPAFVKNRVNTINELTNDCQWCHISGPQNPADCLSRGCDPQQLLSNNLWFNGPDHLRHADYSPLIMPTCAHVTCMLNAGADKQSDECCASEEIFNKFSSFGQLMRVVAWVKRFIYNCKNNVKRSGYLTADELINSSNSVISQIQLKYFAEDISRIKENKDLKSNLKTLSPFMDDNCLLRVGGRLQNAPIPYSQKHPIILPSKCHVTQLIIRNEHIALLHSGLALTVSNLGLKYWIIGVSREVKRVLSKCVKCYRFKAQGASQLMGSLPSDRVTESHPFSKVGVDYCGPFQVKQSSLRRSIVTKGYTLVFVCFATKAINLELVSDMTTQTFLAALKRFIARRGVPQVIHCDNGQSFKGANNTLHELYLLNKKDCHQNSVAKVAADKGIVFKFIPSYSPTFGGLWESAVKSFKYHFKRVVGANIFTYEELNTILIEIEGVLNSRPLTPLSRDPTDLSTLTPGHFLIGRPITCIPEADLAEIPSNRLKFWRRCTQIKQHFWHAWHKQYLSHLNSRPKWHKTLQDIEEGSLVLLKGDNVPPLQWPMARVIKVFRGQDQKVRVAELKTATGITRRSINKLCVLPID